MPGLGSSLLTKATRGGDILLTNSIFPALAIPMILLFCGSLAKKLVRGSNWLRKDFYMGVEFTLAALSSALLYIFDIARDLAQGIQSPSVPLDIKLAATASFISVTLFLLLFLLSIHQEWEWRESERRGQIVWLCIVSNLIGATLIASFVLFVKGLQ